MMMDEPCIEQQTTNQGTGSPFLRVENVWRRIMVVTVNHHRNSCSFCSIIVIRVRLFVGAGAFVSAAAAAAAVVVVVVVLHVDCRRM